jgi:hypothetical protein
MDAHRWLDEYLARIATIRWLQPDAEMDAFEATAQRWVADRVEEHAVALSHANPAEPVTLGWRVVRMIDKARVRSGHVNYAAEGPVAFKLPALAWLALLDDARRSAFERARQVLGPERRVEVADAVWGVLRGPAARLREEAFAEQQRSDHWGYGGRVRGPEDYVVGAPGGEALVTHALWTLSRDDDAPSPWEPLLALWERGVCTLAGLNGSLLVYVPLRHGATLQHTEGVEPYAAHFRGAIGQSGGLRWPAPTKVISETARAALLRFNAHGLGPLPGMYAPVNVSPVTMATNWPGPPDPYVFAPPDAVDADAMDAAERVHIQGLVGAVGAAAPAPLPGVAPAWYARFRPWFGK